MSESGGGMTAEQSFLLSARLQKKKLPTDLRFRRSPTPSTSSVFLKAAEIDIWVDLCEQQEVAPSEEGRGRRFCAFCIKVVPACFFLLKVMPSKKGKAQRGGS